MSFAVCVSSSMTVVGYRFLLRCGCFLSNGVCRSLVVACCVSGVDCWLFVVVCRLLFDVCFVSLAVRCLVARCSLFVVRCSLCVVY